MEVKITRQQVFDPAKQSWVDEELPTISVDRAGSVRNVTAATLLASHYVGYGSPHTVEKVWRIFRARFFAGSPQTLFSVVHSRYGSIDQIYFESPGEQTDLALINPVYIFRPGSVNFWLATPGSAPRGFGVSVGGPES